MVAVQVAGVPATMVTVPVLPVPVQPSLHATVSAALVGVAVRVTAPAENFAVQGAAEVQALMPAGLLVTLPVPTTVTVKSVLAPGGGVVLIVAVQLAGVPATILMVTVLPVPAQFPLQVIVSVAGVAVRVTGPAGNFAVQGAAEVQALIPAGLLVMLPVPTTVTVKSVLITGGTTLLMVAVQVAGVPATMVRFAVLPVPVQPALQLTVSPALVGVAVRVTGPAWKSALQGAAEVQALMPAGLLVTLPLPTTVTDSSVPVDGVVPGAKVATHTAGVLATMVTVLIISVPVQSPVQAIVSVTLAGLAVRVTFPDENLALQGAAEVQPLMPAGLLMTLPVPTTFRVKSPVVGCGVVKVAVQVEGVPATMVTVPVLAAVPALQPSLQTTVAPVGGEAVKVTAPEGKLAVQVGSLAAVQLLIPTGVLLLILPVPTTFTLKAVPVDAVAKVAVQVAGVPATTFTVPMSGLVVSAVQPFPQVTLPPVGTVAIIVTVPVGKLALQFAPPVEVQLVKAVLGAPTLPAPTTVIVRTDSVAGGGVVAKVTSHVTGLVPSILATPVGQVEPQVTPVVGLALKVTSPAEKSAAQVASLAEVQALMPVGLLLAILPLPVTLTVNLDLPAGGGVVPPLKVAVQVAGVLRTTLTVPVLPLPVQPPLQTTVPPVAVKVTVPGTKLAVQVVSPAEVQLLMPVGVLLLIEPVPTTVTFRAD